MRLMLLSLLVVAVVKISAVKAPAAKVAVVASVDTTTVTSAEFYARVEASGASMKDAMKKAAATLTVVKSQPELRLRLLVRMLLSLRMGVSSPKLLQSRLRLLVKRLIQEAEVLLRNMSCVRRVRLLLVLLLKLRLSSRLQPHSGVILCLRLRRLRLLKKAKVRKDQEVKVLKRPRRRLRQRLC